MSQFSGKCDLFDHMSGTGGWFDKDGNPVKIGDPDVHVLYSDEMLDFIAFKKETGGVIHQHKKVKVSTWNQDEVAKRCPGLEIIPHQEQKGKYTKTTYTYKYYDKEYTLKELNKKGVYVTIDIHFNTLLDLIPYYPYIVSMAAHSNGKATIYISQRPFPIEEMEDSLENGGTGFDYWQYYAKKLQDHYKEIVLRYYNPEGYEHVEEVEFDENGIGKVSCPVDDQFDVEWRWQDGKMHTHWTSPKIEDVDQGLIKMHENDLKMLGNKMLVYYVAQRKREIHLG